MRYRETNEVEHFLDDYRVVLGFYGEDNYRKALEQVGRRLRAKGFVTPQDDIEFSLELELLNLERFHEFSKGNISAFPTVLHNAVDFILGLGQTIRVLSDAAQRRLRGRMMKGFKEGLWPLYHELRIAANISRRGYDLTFHDLECDGGYDFLAERDGRAFEVEGKAVSLFTGLPVKPQDLDRLLFEIKQDFRWQTAATIPFLRLAAFTKLPRGRAELQELVQVFSKVAAGESTTKSSHGNVEFLGVLPDMTADSLKVLTCLYAYEARKIIVCNPGDNKLILEVDSDGTSQLYFKVLRVLKDSTDKQFSRTRPAVIWTHFHSADAAIFRKLSMSEGSRACLLDGLANNTLLSQKRAHLKQLVFTGGSHLSMGTSVARSSYGVAVYDSPSSAFENQIILPDGKKAPKTAQIPSAEDGSA